MSTQAWILIEVLNKAKSNTFGISGLWETWITPDKLYRDIICWDFFSTVSNMCSSRLDQSGDSVLWEDNTQDKKSSIVFVPNCVTEFFLKHCISITIWDTCTLLSVLHNCTLLLLFNSEANVVLFTLLHCFFDSFSHYFTDTLLLKMNKLFHMPLGSQTDIFSDFLQRHGSSQCTLMTILHYRKHWCRWK